MSASTNSSSKARHYSKAQQREGRLTVGGVLVCIAILSGGALAAQSWAQDVCPTTPDLAQVCAVLDR